MALLRDLTVSARTPQTIMEVPGKVYIEGQAHDATTLSPIFNDTFTHLGGFPFKTTADTKCVNPISTLYSKFGAIYRGTSTYLRFLPIEFSFVDGAQNSVTTAKLHTNREDMVFIPHNDMYMSTSPKACHVKLSTAEMMSKFDTTTKLGPEGASFVFRETADNFFVFSQPYSLDENTSPQGNGTSMTGHLIYQVSKDDGTTTIIKEGSGLSITSATSSSIISHISSSETQSYFVELAVNNSGSASTVLVSIGSDGKIANGPTHTLGQLTANSFPSNVIEISGNKKAFYTLESGGSNFRFSIVAFDDTKRATGSGSHVTNTRSVPANAINTPTVAGFSSLLGSEFRTNVFTTAQFHYIVVTNNSAKTTGAVPAGFNYIHVYRAPLADPYSIEYISSTKLGENLRISSTFPLDSNFSKFAVVYHDGGIEFVEWNQTAETYVINGYSNIKAEYFGVDQLGRFWVLENGLEPDLHVFNPSVARTVRIGFAEKTAKFDGEPVEVNLLVSAFGYEGERTESNVVLTIDGTTATFLDGATTKTITTEVIKDTTVKIRVVGSGQIQVLANVTS